MPALKLGTRGSPLALYQANTVAHLLRRKAGVSCDVVIIKTSGDRLSEADLSESGGKRLFVKEIEDALLAGGIDLAVHSSKDMPAVLPDGLDIGGVLPREDARDALVLPAGRTPGHTVESLRQILGSSPRIGTSSVRRIAQLRSFLGDARFLPVRGNLDTRLRKLDGGDYDALVLAAAGLRRLEHEARLSALLPVDICVPAPGQGIIAIDVRHDDASTRGLVSAIDDPDAGGALRAERAVVERLGGGCQMPLGAYARLMEDGRLMVSGVVIALDGSRLARAESRGDRQQPEQVGIMVADALLQQGADSILADAARTLSPSEGRSR